MTSPCFLLVDDLDENLISLEALLRRDGLTLLKARSGDEALELLLENDVALALIDVQMPGLNGFELAELMRGNERTRRVPIIFVTAGTADSQRRFRGYEAGAVDFIQKPIEPDVLRSKADVFFELYRQRQQLAEQRDELVAQADALKEADLRKDEFLATLAHELRNPLAPLRLGIDLLRRNSDPSRGPDVLATMDRQLAHLVRLIDDLLDVSRVRHGKIELRKERIEAAAVVRNAVEATRPLIDSSGHSLKIDLPSEPVWIEADLTRLSQVVANLLNNAAKYTPPNGQMRLSVYVDGSELVVDVTDSGVGIPLEMQSKVFELFTQIGNTSFDRSQGGLGIGLALVKQLVELHDGTVSAKSAGAEKGSKFSVRIPRALNAKFEVATSEPTSLPDQKNSLKVLVVDDNIDVSTVVGYMLEEIGHEYEVVHDGPSALDAARYYKPDVVLLDIGLPGMNGYEVCRALRGDPQFKHLPIIAQTGWGHDQDKESARDAGFNSHLTKPVSLEDLEKALHKFQRPAG